MAVYKTIKRGSKGNEVKELQSLLKDKGYTLEEDGIYGEKTQSAVKQYQAAKGLKVDGIVGEKTWGSLKGSGASSTEQLVKQYEANRPQYAPSEDLKAAEEMLKMHKAQKPAAYESAYAQKLESLYNQILNRGDFSYDPTEDPMYARYKDKYIAGGQLAMQNAMANAAALTGGFGNTYAQMAGQQQMNAYMTELSDILPELENRAYLRWRNAEDELYDQIYLTERLDAADYEKYRDTVEDYYEDLDFLYGSYRDTYEAEYDSYLDALEAWQEDRDYYYDAEGALPQTGGGSSGKGSSGGSSGSSSGNSSADSQTAPMDPADAARKGAQAKDGWEKILQSMGNIGGSLREKYTRLADSILKKIENPEWDEEDFFEEYTLPEERWATDLDEEEERIKDWARRK